MTEEGSVEIDLSPTGNTPPSRALKLPARTRQGIDPAIVASVFALIPKLIWPCVLVTVLLLFRGPLSSALSAASTAGGTTIDVAGFKLSLPKNEIPNPPSSIKAVLPRLDADLITNIVSNYGGKNRVDTCYDSASDDEMAADSVKTRLKELKLISFEREPFVTKEGRICPSASLTTYTRDYDMVRAYLIQIISSVKFSQ